MREKVPNKIFCDVCKREITKNDMMQDGGICDDCLSPIVKAIKQTFVCPPERLVMPVCPYCKREMVIISFYDARDNHFMGWECGCTYEDFRARQLA